MHIYIIYIYIYIYIIDCSELKHVTVMVHAWFNINEKNISHSSGKNANDEAKAIVRQAVGAVLCKALVLGQRGMVKVVKAPVTIFRLRVWAYTPYPELEI